MVDKNPLDEYDEELVITTKDSSQKKQVIRKEAVYPSKELTHLMTTPPTKKFKGVSKIGNFLAPSQEKNSLRSSLPAGLRDTSYFDNQDQFRTLLGEKKGKSLEKLDNKIKDDHDPSYGDCDLNLETEFDFE